MKASIQAVRAITGMYFQKLITTGAVMGGTVLVAFWILVIWLTTELDSLWGLFFLLLAPLTVVSFIIYNLLLCLGKELISRPLTKSEKKRVLDMGDKVFAATGAEPTSWLIHLTTIGKDVLRGKESAYIKEVISNTAGLRDDFLNVREIFLH